mgnify:FL=1
MRRFAGAASPSRPEVVRSYQSSGDVIRATARLLFSTAQGCAREGAMTLMLSPIGSGAGEPRRIAAPSRSRGTPVRAESPEGSQSAGRLLGGTVAL